MPELPEVETTRRGIEKHLVGRRVTSVLVRQSSLRWPVSPELGQCLTGQEINHVSRRAKYLLIETNRGRVMLHLGMSGSLRVLPDSALPQKHDHLDFCLEDGNLLRFRDPRRFGSVFWLADQDSHELLDHLGPEPLGDEFTAEHLFKRSRGKKVAVKNFIMDGHVVVGVGNIYANEALFNAGIRPDKAAGTISRRRYERLRKEIRDVLKQAIQAGGTTLRDFVQENGNPGYFRHELKVYGRGELPCMQCGRSLREIRLGQRTTVFCTSCQT